MQAAQPELPQLARLLTSREKVGCLSTMSRRHEGYPFGSLMPYALDAGGRPIFLISRLAMHTRHLLVNPYASLMVADPVPADEAMAAARVTLVGDAVETSDPEAGPAYLARHPYAREWARFGDFAYFVLNIREIYYVGGFGLMGWVDPAEYAV